MVSVSVRIAAANGDGIESSGTLLAKAAARKGLHIFGYRGYQSVIRGGHVWFSVRIADEKIYDHGETIDILVALNQDAVDHQASHLSENAFVIYDSGKIKVDKLEGKGFRLLPIPLHDIAVETSGDPIVRNVVALGAVMKITGIGTDTLHEILKETFGKKGDKIVEQNVKAADKGYGYEGVETAFSLKSDNKKLYVMDGNTALSIGAYSAGCKFYAAYPMTPASSILHWFAAHEDKGVFVKQTEDEIAAINMTIGAASAGVRAMCGTSGGGFSLMVEGLGLAGMIEAPIVVVESQRTGPSTGLPTKTEQGDLLFVMNASQGEFPRIVVAPRDVEECFYVGKHAFNLAEKYQCPVVIMSDLFLSEHIESIESFDIDRVSIDRGKIATAASEGRFKRYLLTEDGVSPRSIPGTPDLEFTAASDEHNEYGDLVSDVLSGIDEHVEMRNKMHSKRMRKLETMLKNESCFAPTVESGAGSHSLVCFGSTTEASREAVKILKSKGIDVGLVSFSYLLPLDSKATADALKGKKLIDVEVNYTSQLAQIIKLCTGIDVDYRINKYDGEAITGDEIARKAEQIIKGVV